MKKLFTLLVVVCMAVGAMAQEKLTFHPGDHFMQEKSFLVHLSWPADSRTEVLEIEYRDDDMVGEQIKLVLTFNGRPYVYYLKRGDFMYVWSMPHDNNRFAFWSSPQADSLYHMREKYKITKIADNLIEFTRIETVNLRTTSQQ